MKKYLILFLTLIFVQKIAFAYPIIQNVLVNPQDLWLGESPTITLSCYDNESKAISKVYANIVGPGIILPTLEFTGNYNLTVNKAYLDRIGNYNVTIFCNNSDNESAVALTSFTVSKLTGYISSIQPSPGYANEEMEIGFFVKKDNVPITNDVSFNVTLNDIPKQLKIAPAYDLVKGWLLKIDLPSEKGFYNLKVYAFYDRTNVSNSSLIEVRKRIEFEINSLSKNWVSSNENITLSIKAKDQGNVIDLNDNNLDIEIASTNLNINSIEKIGDLYNVKITTPSLSAGRYEVKATLYYENNYYTATKPIDYIVTVSGDIVDENNKAINTQIKFFLNNIEKLSLTTDSVGHYSGSLPPDTYDVKIIFPQSTLYLKGVSVSNFNDPIKYYYSTDSLVEGIRNAGLFSFDVALSYSEAEIEMKYEEKNVIDETNLVIFKCSSWNSGRKVCNYGWFEIGGNFDIVRNIVKVNLNSLSAFVIGERKPIIVNFNLDSEKYYIGSTIKIRGLVKDQDGSAVANASIKAKIKNINKSIETFSDNNGVFTFELKAPEEEGEYILELSATKSPYISFSGSKSFDVVKSRSITIVAPETIRIKQGQKLTQEISLINTGQADLINLNVSLSGIPSNYYNVTNFIERLKANEENKIYIYFSIPEDAEKKTYSLVFSIFNNEIKQEKIIGFTVIDKNETTTTTPSGKFIMPKIDFDMLYLIAFAIICFSIAIILKKLKLKRLKRNEITSFLFDVKGYLKRTNLTKIKDDYENLILSEFPNALRKIREKYGKDN
ncbi:MAG: hypothetical protein QXK49_01755 [Candidatus Aenigmatarchaeota archaeon]